MIANNENQCDRPLLTQEALDEVLKREEVAKAHEDGDLIFYVAEEHSPMLAAYLGWYFSSSAEDIVSDQLNGIPIKRKFMADGQSVSLFRRGTEEERALLGPAVEMRVETFEFRIPQ